MTEFDEFVTPVGLVVIIFSARNLKRLIAGGIKAESKVTSAEVDGSSE